MPEKDDPKGYYERLSGAAPEILNAQPSTPLGADR
jgi:hypothetical protein